MKKETDRVLDERGYRFLRPFLTPIFKFYYRPQSENREVIPAEGPIIFAGNHRHIMDQCLVIISTKRVVHYMAKKEYFDGKFAWFFRMTGVIPVDRSIHDESAKSSALEVLNRGKALGIFPEGTRNKTPDPLIPFKMGTVSMAKKTGATIVPFAIRGRFKFWAKPKIIFGTPFKVPKDMPLEEANTKLYNEILKLYTGDKNEEEK